MSGAENGRSVYQMSVAASDVDQAQTVIACILCPDPDHVGPCPVPWESASSIASGSVVFVLYATDGQAGESLAEVRTRELGEVRLNKSTDENGQDIDGSLVIEQFRIEQGLSES
jgi:hypothetical protein